jgi:hypothetical protein
MFRLRICILGSCLAAPFCQASPLQYTFSYSATGGPIQNFSFSFIEPAFVLTGGALPSFIPFTLTDGTASWTMTQDLVNISGCFMFGTPFARLGNPGPFGACAVSVGGPGISEGGFFLAPTGGLPSATGTYGSVMGGSFDTPAGFESINQTTGIMTLTITQVAAEPSNLSLAVAGLLVLSALAKRDLITSSRKSP